MDAYSNQTSANFYDYLFVELADPRTNNWFLIKNPLPTLTVLILYLYFVKSWGPRFMKNRKPFEFKYTLIIYNFLQVLLSTFIVYEAVTLAWWSRYSFKCEPVDYSHSDHALRIARGVYIYFLAKMTELLDTVFFVLRKKYKQITFLHVYHHSVMPIVSWGCTKYLPGGHEIFIGSINSFIHIIMYSYYMVAALGPEYQKYLWWKKYITALQLLQFLLMFLHSIQLLFYDCGYPKWTLVITAPNALFFYYLFSDFYKEAYRNYNRSDCKKLN